MIDIPSILNENRQLIDYFKAIHFRVLTNKECVNQYGEKHEIEVKKNSYFKEKRGSIFLNYSNALVKFKTPFLVNSQAIIDYLAAEQAVFLRKLGDTVYLDADQKNGSWQFDVKLNPFFYSELNKQRNLKSFEQDLIARLKGLSSIFTSFFKEIPVIKLKKDGEGAICFSFSNLNFSTQTEVSVTCFDIEVLRLFFLYAVYSLEKKQTKQNLTDFLSDLEVMLSQLNGTVSEFELLKELSKESNDTDKKVDGISQMQQYHIFIRENPFQLPGFEEMELSTQLMLASAIEKGIEFEILDSNDQFVKLYYQNHVEYVKNTNMTSLDSYVSPLIMENKTVTKNILNQNGFRVPMGQEFSSIATAEASYTEFCHQKIVVKPKTTNFGLGISIFEEGFTQIDFNEAIRIAFEEDNHILIEEFMSGTEYRFYVLEGEVEGIILRIPANIEGDGVRTVEELVNQKNQDPLRGTHYRRPLQLIKLNDVEKLMLKTQGMTIKSIPAKGQVVYLRENSNVSTGGDSIDMTDDMDESYKQIAAAAVQSLGAFVSGIDLMIEDNHKPTNQISLDYGIIEANFNPAIHMHMYPFKGKGRPLASKMLDKLFPEILIERDKEEESL